MCVVENDSFVHKITWLYSLCGTQRNAVLLPNKGLQGICITQLIDKFILQINKSQNAHVYFKDMTLNLPYSDVCLFFTHPNTIKHTTKRQAAATQENQIKEEGIMLIPNP